MTKYFGGLITVGLCDIWFVPGHPSTQFVPDTFVAFTNILLIHVIPGNELWVSYFPVKKQLIYVSN